MASNAYLNFIARVTGASAGLKLAYQGFLDGLTTDGLFNSDGTSSYFDALYIFATQNSATALLNLVSSSFTGTVNGSPAFKANQGFTGVSLSTTVYIDTGFNPTTASSPKFTQNSAHVSVWPLNNLAAAGGGDGITIGLSDFSSTNIDLRPRYSDDNYYARINDSGSGGGGKPNTDSRGHFLANRSGASTIQGYKNAVDQGFAGTTSAVPQNANIFILACDTAGTGASGGSALQLGSASIGGSLTAAQVTNFYNRLNTFMWLAAQGFPTLSASNAYLNFISRVSNASAGLKQAYQQLLDGLTTDGLFNADGTSSYFDVLYILATQDSPTALLNLVSSSFTGITHGSPAFSANQGFTGVDASTTVYIDTGFNPTTASSPKFMQNSAHLSGWSDSNVQSSASGGTFTGQADNGGGLVVASEIFPRYSDGNAYFRCNDGNPVSAGVLNADATGHYLANRSGASAQQAYRNAVDLGMVAVASAAPRNNNFYVLASDRDGAGAGSACRVKASSIGASLIPAQVTSLYNRLGAFMTRAAAGFPFLLNINLMPVKPAV